jgi:co-chaperonin GroES (HSP10)
LKVNIYMHPVSPLNYVFVKMDAFNEKVQTKNGFTLYKDVTYNPEWSATLSADALTIPLKVVGNNLDNTGIIPFVKKGDTVLFRYMVVMQIEQLESATIHHNQHLINGEMYWKVDYSMILGVLREGKIIAAPGYVFAKKIIKNNEDKIGSLYLAEMMKSEVVKNRAIVEYIGDNKKNVTKLQIKEGDTIVFNDKLAEKYDINGEQFLVIRQEYIVGKDV